MSSINKNIEDSFDKFINSSNLNEILSAFNQLCDLLDLNPSENSSSFYRTLQNKIKGYWKAQSLFEKLEKKISQKEYRRQTACSNIKVLIIGSGPCGLKCAIELALLGARVVIIEKRDSFSRNNVLHLWPFVIEDLKSIGAKTFFGMFCAGSIDHISIRRLQCILLKVALLFGVQIFVGVTFQSLIAPVQKNNVNVTAKGDMENSSELSDNIGWRAKVIPHDHIVSNYEFSVLVGADGKSNKLGFPRKELRCRLAIAITANFINKNTPEEAQVEEISGVAFIFNQQYFKDIYHKTGIDLENIVYYKDETHYFVMTAKKQSLLAKGVLKEDSDDPGYLLNFSNINYGALENFGKEIANVVTNYKIPNLEYSKNHRNEPDVAVFDFTHMFAAENASKITEINGFVLLQMLVGDSLLEPFWPTGSGCALGFLSCMDAAWLVRRIGMISNALEQNKISSCHQKVLMLEAIAERESVYQRLSQTTPSNMPPNFNLYTLNPRTRYTQCKMNCIETHQILHLYDTDDKNKKHPCKNDFSAVSKTDLKTKQNQFATLNSSKLMGLNLSFNSSFKETSINDNCITNNSMKGEYMLRWFQIRLDRYFDHKCFKIDDLSKSWVSGVAFLCLIHLYRPHLIDLSSINDKDHLQNLETAFILFEKEFHVENFLKIANSIENLDPTAIFSYLEKVYETLRVLNPNRSEEIYKYRSNDLRQIKRRFIAKKPQENKFDQTFNLINSVAKPVFKSSESRFMSNDIEKGIIKTRKEEILKLYNAYIEKPSIITTLNKYSAESVDSKNAKIVPNKLRDIKHRGNDKNSLRLFEKHKTVNQSCHFCKIRISHQKHDKFENYLYHKHCFRCQYCNKDLNNQQFKLLKFKNESEGKFYCLRHFEKLSNISFIREKNVSNTLRDLVLKEDKKLKKMSIKDGTKTISKNGHEKFKKPRYCLKDFGCTVPENQISLLPVDNIFTSKHLFCKMNVEVCSSQNLLSLRRINDESDEEYNGSVDESKNTLISLDVVEPLDDNQYSWSLCFNKQDLDYAFRKCQVIRKNRLIYKKYKSKEESTSDESEINLLVHDICKTSDEDILENIDKNQPSDMEIPEVANEKLLQRDDSQNQVASNVCNSENNSSVNIVEQENSSKITEENNIESNLIHNDSSDLNKITTNKENSKNLRQLAKLKFCTEPPKPVSINPKEFISQINHNKMKLINLPYHLEIAECLPSINEVFVSISEQCCQSRLPSITVSESSVLSARLLSTKQYGSNLTNVIDFNNPFDNNSKYEISNVADCFEDSNRNLSKRNNNNIPENLFGDIYDIKDIDSLSINTEDSSVTHTEIISENENFKNLSSLKYKKNEKATIDSELDISLGMPSIGEIPYDNKFSINSLNSISTSSLNSSIKSDFIASSESEDKYRKRKTSLNENISDNNNNNRFDEIVKCTDTKSNVKNHHQRHKNSSKLKRINKHYKRQSMKNQKLLKSYSTIDETMKIKETSDNQNSMFCNTVTPPHDIELDDNPIKCLEMKSQFPFIIEGSIPLKDIDNISSKFQRINHIDKQLENIEDRLNDFNCKEIDYADISIGKDSKTVFREQSIGNEKVEENSKS